MIYRVLAEIVLVTHLAFIIFVVAGGLLALRWRWAPLVHLPAALWGVYIALSGGICPLTPLENRLRRAAGSSGYSGGFIEHYIVPIIYPESLTDSFQLVMVGALVLANVAIYSVVLWHRRGRSRRRPND